MWRVHRFEHMCFGTGVSSPRVWLNTVISYQRSKRRHDILRINEEIARWCWRERKKWLCLKRSRTFSGGKSPKIVRAECNSWIEQVCWYSMGAIKTAWEHCSVQSGLWQLWWRNSRCFRFPCDVTTQKRFHKKWVWAWHPNWISISTTPLDHSKHDKSINTCNDDISFY